MTGNENGITLGRGEIFLGRYNPGRKAPEGLRYVGVSSALSVSSESDEQTYMSKEGGVDEIVESAQMSVTRSGSFTTESINDDNIAMFFMGDKSRVTVDQATGATHTIDSAELGLSYQVGVSEANPVGLRNISDVSASIPAGDGTAEATPLEDGTDFSVNLETGMLTLLPSSPNVTDGATVDITYSADGYTQNRVLSGNKSIYVSLRYIAENITGPDRHYFFPYVKLTPSGDYALKSDEWMALTFNLQVMKPRSMEAVYVDGHPLAQ